MIKISLDLYCISYDIALIITDFMLFISGFIKVRTPWEVTRYSRPLVKSETGTDTHIRVSELSDLTTHKKTSFIRVSYSF